MRSINMLIFTLLLSSTNGISIPSLSARDVVRGAPSLTSGLCASLGAGTGIRDDHDELSRSKKATTPLNTKFPSPYVGRTAPLSRRAVGAAGAASVAFVLSLPKPVHAKDLSEEYRQGTAALSDSDDTAPVPREAYKKLESGVIYADLRPGGGDTVKQGSKVNLQWVLRKSNGYFVDSSATHDSVPFIFTVGDGTAIQGLDDAVRGMKEGSVRRVLIPPSLAYVDGLEDGKPGPLPYGYGPRQQMRRVQNIRKDVPGEYVYLEVQATRVR